MALVPEETLERIKIYRNYALEAKTNEEGYKISMRGLEAAVALLEQIKEQTKDYSIILKKD